ncbi:MAG: radical SAM protein [Desulfobacterales bacterium]|nr:radical SAM protein [Desulfobacterales bacterium]
MTRHTIDRYRFETGMYRPPSEGGSASLLVRFTRNCPWNHCTFCSMYKRERFQLRPLEELKADVDAMAALIQDLEALSGGDGIRRDGISKLFGQVPELNDHDGLPMLIQWYMNGGRTAFIQDANSVIMKTPDLVAALAHLRTTFPSIERVTSYARARTLSQKSLDELKAIRVAGLDRLHLGLETGDDILLKEIKKGVTAQGHAQGGKKAMDAGFQVSEYWMPGLGGRARTREHARNTARVLNQINPHYIRSRPFRPIPGTPMAQQVDGGSFLMLTPHEQLEELREMIQLLDVTSHLCFDHAMNHWKQPNGRLLFTQDYEGYRFPQEKNKVLDLIELGLSYDQRPDSLVHL